MLTDAEAGKRLPIKRSDNRELEIATVYRREASNEYVVNRGQNVHIQQRTPPPSLRVYKDVDDLVSDGWVID